jgi:hypothetical protein
MVGVGGVSAEQLQPEKQDVPVVTHAAKRMVVQPGELVRWRSPRVGEAYASGVAMRLTDCRKGRRVRYARFRVVNSNIRPVVVVVKLHGRL